MKLIWLGYLVCNLGNCTMKLYIKAILNGSFMTQFPTHQYFENSA